MLKEVGFTPEQVEAETAIEADRIDIPLAELRLYLDASKIHGKGLKTSVWRFQGETLGPMSMEGKRTQLGRYTNHSDNPNAYPYRVNGGILMVAAGTIAPGAEITVDYREMLVINGRLDVASQLEKPTEAKIYSAERFLATLPQTEVDPRHVFADGIYSRELLIPAGNWITGKVHKQNDLNIVVYGHMKVMTSEGFKEVAGPAHFTGKAGVKKIGYAYEDTLWITVHHTHLTDLDEIEKELFEDNGEPKVLDFKTGKSTQESLT